MKNLLSIMFLSMSFESAVAAVELVQSPIVCGTVDEIDALLNLKMDGSTSVGEGTGSQGQKVASLFSDDKHWALVTRFTGGRICVVASGREWRPMESKTADPT